MDSIKDIIYSLVRDLSDTNELSLSRVIKSIYLFDWSRILNSQVKHLDLEWILSICGPNCSLIETTILQNSDLFGIVIRDNKKGGVKRVVCLNDVDYQPVLSEASIKAIRHVVRVTKGMPWESLQQLINSTMPVIMSRVGNVLSLQTAAEIRWKEIRA